ncbi:MAG: prephenate dehydrogenase [Bacillota bacterium]|nr:prephenate dehydrogenase [Bacillota bacterium]
MNDLHTVTIVGLGLIGGSFAKALSRAGIENIYAVDNNCASITSAIEDGIIKAGGTELNEKFCNADVILVCTPAEYAPEIIEKAASMCGKDTIIADTASVSLNLINSVRKIKSSFRYVSTHPMAGSEKGGYDASKAHLFENAYAIISPCERTDDNSIIILTQLYKTVGAIPVVLDGKSHDEAVGLISHLPHAASAALVNLLSKCDTTDKMAQSIAAGGFKDITRISSSSPLLWADISFQNKEVLKNLIDKYISELKTFQDFLASDDKKGLEAYFASAKETRDRLPSISRSLIGEIYEISIDVEDKVGVTSFISETLSRENISIKAISIENSREFDGGVMTIAVSSDSDLKKSLKVLREKGINARDKNE